MSRPIPSLCYSSRLFTQYSIHETEIYIYSALVCSVLNTAVNMGHVYPALTQGPWLHNTFTQNKHMHPGKHILSSPHKCELTTVLQSLQLCWEIVVVTWWGRGGQRRFFLRKCGPQQDWRDVWQGRKNIPRQKVQLYGICKDSKTILKPVWVEHRMRLWPMGVGSELYRLAVTISFYI